MILLICFIFHSTIVTDGPKQSIKVSVLTIVYLENKGISCKILY